MVAWRKRRKMEGAEEDEGGVDTRHDGGKKNNHLMGEQNPSHNTQLSPSFSPLVV